MRIKYKGDLNKLFFTSDNHFYHDSIIKYCHRPFNDVEEQNNTLIQNWNRVIPKDGVVFVLGDFIHSGNIELIKGILNRLNGEIHLIMGNHCYQNKFDRGIIKEMFGNRVYDTVTLTIPGDSMGIFMSHYPHLYWHRGANHIHGHVHSGPNSTSEELVPFHRMRYDVGVDNNDFYPVSYNKLINIFEEYGCKEVSEEKY